ncbi:MAG: hypothetical protein AAGK97_03905, partial [Bacteroidota bacterium]
LNLSAQHWSEFLNQGKSLEGIDEDINEHVKSKSEEDKNRILKHYRRWRIFASYNYVPNQEEAAKIDAEKWNAAENLKSEIVSHARNNFGSWENVTPDTLFYEQWPNYGVVQDITFDRNDNNTMYVGTHGAGLLRRNADGTWDDLTFGMPVQGITGIVADSNRISFITGSKFWWSYFRFQGICYSDDFGKTWKVQNFMPSNLPGAIHTYGLRVHPSNSNIQYALTSWGVFMTFNGWETYSRRTLLPVYDLIFDPVHSDSMYFNMQHQVYKTNTSLSYYDLVFEDEGAHKVLLAKSNIAPFSLYFAACNDTLGRVNFYKTDDDGETTIFRSQRFRGQLGWNWCFGLHPASNDQLFFGTVGFEKSNDGALSWQDAGGRGLHADQHDLEWRGNQLFVANDGGISYSSSYLKDSWDASYSIGMKNMFITNIDVLNNKFIGGFWHAGSQTWTIGDNSSFTVGGGDGFECFYDPYSPNDYYTTTQNPGFWKNSSSPLFDPESGAYWGQPFLPDPNNSNYLYFCQNRLYRFNKTTEQFQDVNITVDTIRIERIGICRNQSNIGYAIMYPKDLPAKFIRFNVGNASIDLSASLPVDVKNGFRVTEIVVDENDPAKVWMVVSGYDIDNIYYTSNSGFSWNYIGTASLPKVPIFAMQRIQDNNQLYVGTEYGIYYKNDDMSDWIRFSNGLGYQRVVDLDIDNGYIYASIWGSGIWRTLLRSGCPQHRFLLSTTHTNPYSPGYTRLEAFGDIVTDLEFVTNEGTDIEISGERKVTLLPGFKASSIVDDNFDYLSRPRIQIKSEACRN